MTVIETGMTVRLLVDDVTGGPLRQGDICSVESKTTDSDGTPMYWAARTREKQSGGYTVDRAPFFGDEIDPMPNPN